MTRSVTFEAVIGLLDESGQKLTLLVLALWDTSHTCLNRSMFTELEGSWDQVFDVVKRATEAVAPFGSRVSLVIKADIQAGYERDLDGKLERPERAIEESGSSPLMS